MLNITQKQADIADPRSKEQQPIWGIYCTDQNKQIMRGMTHDEAIRYQSENCPVYGRNRKDKQ